MALLILDGFFVICRVIYCYSKQIGAFIVSLNKAGFPWANESVY